MKFEINNQHWEIIRHNTKRLKEIVSKIQGEELDFVYGYTYYPTQKILINSDLTIEQQLFSLRHELTHCYIWCCGLCHVDFNDCEIVSDIVASSNDFINKTILKYEDWIKKEDK